MTIAQLATIIFLPVTEVSARAHRHTITYIQALLLGVDAASLVSDTTIQGRRCTLDLLIIVFIMIAIAFGVYVVVVRLLLLLSRVAVLTLAW